jgi:hypothetical protein
MERQAAAESDVSVVVASFSGEAALGRCLESLEPQAAAAEVVVATDAGAGAVGRLRERFPALPLRHRRAGPASSGCGRWAWSRRPAGSWP